MSLRGNMSILLSALMLVPAVAALHAEAKKEKIIYKVKKGDTLIKIASRYNVEIESIMDWNKEKFKHDEKEKSPPKGKKIKKESYPSVILPGTKLKIPKKGPNGKAITHKVKGGETFIGIARKYDVTKVKLYKWNKKVFGPSAGKSSKGGKKKKKCVAKKGKKKKGKVACEQYDTNTIYPDMELVIFASRPDLGPRIGLYRANASDTPMAVAKKFKVKLDNILDYNFLAKTDKLVKNEILDIPMPLPAKKSISVGSPTSGKLIHGEKLPKGPGYVIRSPEYSYGTNETITHVVNCIADVQREFPGTHDLVVGHLSKKNGGKFRPHKSHSSGRDIDMSFYFKGLKPKKFIKVSAGNFDVSRTMHFILCLIDTKELEYIFVNYYIQKMMYNYMKKKKYENSFLAKLIQYPKPVDKRVAYIRHDKGHDDHMHVRFKCPENSKKCHD